ncbi:MAG TPA: ABC transporter permease subunit [Methanomassiliicoccales archaeon]|nr:ABC transporter permease subunit [Methanomassiliicoccales archaeon]
MSLDPIGYKPWSGKRTEHNRRPLVIADHILNYKIRSIWLIGLMILGMVLVHVFPLMINSLVYHKELTATTMNSYMQSDLFFIFNIILVSLICSDLFSDDLRSNSIILYLSRAMSTGNYFLGKWMGAMLVLCFFTLVPPLAASIAIMATQAGPDYGSSLVVVLQTFLAGLWTALLLIPVGLAISAATSKRTYAGVATFMFFFVMFIVSSILFSFSDDWLLLSPMYILFRSYDVIYGITMPSGTNVVILAGMIFILMVPPLWFVYDKIRRKGVGK